MPAMRQLKQTEFSAYGGWITWGVVAFTVVWIIAAAVTAFVLHASGEVDFLHLWRKPLAWGSLLVLAISVIVAAFALMLVIASIKCVRCRRAYGDSTLIVTHYPDAASNDFRARVLTGAAAARQRRFTIRLRETIHISTGRGKAESATTEEEVWSRTLLLDPRYVKIERGRAVIPMEFDLAGVPEPPEDTPSEKTTWSVEVRAKGPRPDYHAFFTLTPTGSPFIRFGRA